MKAKIEYALKPKSLQEWFPAADIEVTQIGEGPLDSRETLYIVSIGVNRYSNILGCVNHITQQPMSCDLEYPKADAIAFEKMVRDRMGEGKGHKKVVSRVLYNGAPDGADEPTFANINNAINILYDAGPKDTAVLFLAGHGTNRSAAGYQFLPSDARPKIIYLTTRCTIIQFFGQISWILSHRPKAVGCCLSTHVGPLRYMASELRH
jgi:hypothetical protein